MDEKFEQFLIELRDYIYEGGQKTQSIIQDIEFAIKYAIVEDKFNEEQIKYIKESCQIIIDLFNKSREQIIEEWDLEEYM